MADLNDITGWREELEAFKATAESKDFFRQTELRDGEWKPRRFEPTPASLILQLTKLHFEHAEIHDALKEYTVYQMQIDVLDDGTEHAQENKARVYRPIEAIKILDDFRMWYAFKLSIPYDDYPIGLGEYYAYAVESGEFETADSIELLQHIKRRPPLIVNFDLEGDAK